MKKTDIEYEYIIKGLIDANLLLGFGNKNIQECCNCWVLKYSDKEFEIALHKQTDHQSVLSYFYAQLMKEEFNKDER